VRNQDYNLQSYRKGFAEFLCAQGEILTEDFSIGIPGIMALADVGYIRLLVITLGVLSFVLGIIAENKKPAGGTAIPGKGVVICKYPHDPSIALGSFSIIFLLLSSICGVISIFYPYKGKAVSVYALQRSPALVVFSAIAVALFFLAEGLMMWATITEGLHRTYNTHHNLDTDCPTAKTGLFGGAAFLALDTSLFWLICQMLTLNARADYELDDDEDLKGKYGQVMATDYNAAGAAHLQPSV